VLYPRRLHPALREHLSSRQITVITGMRRTGKTTLVKQLLSDIASDNKIYIDLERIDNREIFAEKNYDAIVYTLRQRGIDTGKRAYLALDEIQLVQTIPSVLKYLYDICDIKFIVTGSSSYYLKNLFSESLSGRKKVFELYPLDFGEMLTFREVPHSPGGDPFMTQFNSPEYERLKGCYEEYIEYGGFPEVVLASKAGEKRDLINDVISSYVNIDVRTLADFRNRDGLYQLMKMLASRSSTRLEYSKLSRLSGLSRVTVQNYIEFLEKTYLIRRVPVMTRNPDREIVKAKKLYFCDNGILSVLGNVSSGVKFENAVFTQLHQRGALSYYSLKNGREIDFILEKAIALEVKESPDEQDEVLLRELSGRVSVKKHRLVGRHPVPRFKNYVWGGEIR